MIGEQTGETPRSCVSQRGTKDSMHKIAEDGEVKNKMPVNSSTGKKDVIRVSASRAYQRHPLHCQAHQPRPELVLALLERIAD
jgi:hypothetical protein